MIKVLFVISTLNRQGPVSQLLYLCKYIDRSVIAPMIVTTSQKSFEGSMHEQFKKIGIEIVDLKLDMVDSIFFAANRIQSIIDSREIDVIQSFGFRSDIISHNLKRVHKITLVRYTMIFNYRMIYGPVLGSILGHINLRFMRKFDCVLACSHSVHENLKTLNLHSDVIINSVDPVEVSRRLDEAERQRVRTSLDLSKDGLVFITVSSKRKGKNIEFLANSFTKRGLAGYMLVIAGYVDQTTLQEYRNARNVLFLGNVSNLSEYFRASDFFISASLHEGMPNAVLEAMSVGTPVILSDIPSHKEIFDKASSQIGTIFENNNFDDLRRRIQEVISFNHAMLSTNCIRVIKDKFSARTMAREYAQYYLSRTKKYNHAQQIASGGK